MLSRTYSAVIQGLQPVKIEVEIEATVGTPQFLIIGLATKEVDEAKERITATLLNCGVPIRAKRTVVNLAPADVKKTGSGLELAIAVGLFKYLESVTFPTDEMMFFGELSLDGSVKPVRGALPLVLAARAMGFREVVIPQSNAGEVRAIADVVIHPVRHFLDIMHHLRQEASLAVAHHVPFSSDVRPSPEVDLSDIAGHPLPKRGLEIAAAGGHNLLMVGPPGAGKSMLAQALSGILPPLSQEEATLITSIYSIAGLLNEPQALIAARPFRSPHHTTSLAGLTGGGVPLLPGEITLAHLGVLFLDELPEFPRICLEALRQPLEQRMVTITRASGSYHFPAQFALVAAANPCPCGYAGSTQKACRCTRGQRLAYTNRISGPLLDRIDLHLWVNETPLAQLRGVSKEEGERESSAVVGARVARARTHQQQRYQNPPSDHQPPDQHPISCNGELTTKQVKQYCQLTQSASRLLLKAAQIMKLSARAYTRTIKVAQTIADLDNAPRIEEAHISEAVQYRTNVWQVGVPP